MSTLAVDTSYRVPLPFSPLASEERPVDATAVNRGTSIDSLTTKGSLNDWDFRMAVDVALNTPLADALGNAVQTKLMETGWASGGLDDSALGEYIILMLVNGKTQEQIAAELSTDLLSLPPEDKKPTEFASWLFDQAELLNQQLNQLTSGQEQGASIRGAAARQAGEGGSADATMSEAMEDVQDGAMYVFLAPNTFD